MRRPLHDDSNADADSRRMPMGHPRAKDGGESRPVVERDQEPAERQRLGH
jgi:hypothetical protein